MENNKLIPPVQPAPQGNPLDPTVVNLAKAIRQTESGGNFNAKGKSGEHGAYQFMPDTWSAWSQKHLGQAVPLEQATPEQQNEVAYKQIKEWKDQGLNVGQVASMWNSGKPDWEGNVGVNKAGVKFDTPAYVNSVSSAYQKIKGGQDVTIDPKNPSAAVEQTQDKGETYGAVFPASPDDNPLEAGAKAVGNVPSSFLHLLGGLGSAVFHPLNTLKGVAKVGMGGLEKLGGHEADGNTATFDAFTKTLKDRYGSLDNLQKTATNDPFGFGTDVLTLLQGGAAGLDALKGAETASTASKVGEVGAKTASASETLDNAISKVGSTALAPVKKVAGMAGNAAAEVVGAPLGVGGGVVKEAVGSAMAGGDKYKAFVQGLSGNTSPEEMVGQAKEALGEVIDSRDANYSKMIEGLKGDSSTYSLDPIHEELQKQLTKFGIGTSEDGSLDFSRSKFALDTSARNDVQKLVDYVNGYGLKEGDASSLGIDNLKKVLGGYFSPNSDYRALVQGLKSKTREVLESAPGYSDEMRNYADMSDQIKDIRQGLSLGDKAMVETSFKKLTSAFKQNNEFRAQLVKELDEATGGQLSSKIAGQQMSSWLPRGLAGTIEKAGGLAGVVSGHFLPVLAGALITSPKMVGEFIRGIGLSAEATRKVLDVLGRMAPSGEKVVEGANVVNRLTPPQSAFNSIPQP